MEIILNKPYDVIIPKLSSPVVAGTKISTL